MADRVVDLDALRAKRIEIAPSRTVKFGGRDWALVPELPFEVGEMHRAGRRRDVVRSLLVDPTESDVDEFMAAGPSEEDMGALVREAYGASQGE